MVDVEFEEHLEIAAKAMFNDCKGEKDYPFTTWKEQADEMRTNCSKEFIKQSYEWGKDHYELDKVLQ